MTGLIASGFLHAQTSVLTVESIMRDPKWIGASPSQPEWGNDGDLYFRYNPDQAEADSVYYVHKDNFSSIRKSENQRSVVYKSGIISDQSGKLKLYNQDSDIFLIRPDHKVVRLFYTARYEWATGFDVTGRKIIYKIGDDIFTLDPGTSEMKQVLSVAAGRKTEKEVANTIQDKLLEQQQIALFKSFGKKEKKHAADRSTGYYEYDPGKKNVLSTTVSPDLRFISIRTSKDRADNHSTIMPNYVTGSGYTEVIKTRPKVGEQPVPSDLAFYSFDKDTLINFDLSVLPGIRAIPEYLKDYPLVFDSLNKAAAEKACRVFDPAWSPDGSTAVIQVYSLDNKDRWLVSYNPLNHTVRVIEHQHDEAWVGGPLIGGNYSPGWCQWVGKDIVLFASESSGYTHIYRYDIATGTITPLTGGSYEIQEADLSPDKRTLYLVTNQGHPGSKTLVHLDLKDKAQHVTIDWQGGMEDVTFSPDGKHVAFLGSFSNHPWELYVAENKKGGQVIRITDKAKSAAFRQYPWRQPEIVQFKASDGQSVYARLYKPAGTNPNRPAVIFVHGAGYLQNAHNWWSYYFREYMFHNMLSDLGYTVLDIDYRASAGYGRDWRTAIYRHMGGKDLDDQVDGARYLVAQHGVDKGRIGIYGGSYGGFITLMALFTRPGVFKCGAALRPVTDWMHYNHGYTSNILNTPATDSLAYAQSSPINFASGLSDRLLICHGMLDDNVHFQDVVRLQQRLIELGKDNWEVAAYPLEAHGFKSAEAWTDEYKRILKLFQETLNN